MAARVLGDGTLARATTALRRRVGAERLPQWSRSIPQPAPSRLPSTTRHGAAAVYLPACINRIFGNPRGGSGGPTLPEALVAVSARAGMPVWIPPDVAGHCCGVPWSSKGHHDGHAHMSEKTAAALARWSEGGRLPVVIDASSCTHGVLEAIELDGIEVLDSITWVHDQLLPKLSVARKLRRAVVHPTCSSAHLGLSGKLASIARELADEVVIPAGTSCCGMAGDRGLLHPELPASALRDLVAELAGEQFDACVSSNRTCEIALHHETGRRYGSFVLTLEELTR
jgi:D-lactate dehydrogenase